MKLICTLFLSALTPLLWAQAVLTKDIHEGSGDGIPNWYEDNAVLGNVIIFAADNGTIGSELYKLENGTVTLVKDILEGEKGSEPLRFIAYNNLVYFSARNENGRYDIYSTDGTAANTKPVILLNEGDHVGEFFVSRNGKLYFNIGTSIYVSGGTEQSTSKIETGGTVDFSNSWTYASTNIVNYLDGVAFSGYSGQTYSIFYHDGEQLETLTEFSAGLSTMILGPVNSASGLVYATQDSFYPEYVGLYTIDTETNEVSEILIDDASVNTSRLYEINETYCLIKPFSKGFYSYNGEVTTEITGGGTSFLLYQGQRLPHGVIGDEVFFLGEDNFLDHQYFISDGTVEGTRAVETPERPYTGRNILTKGNALYMFQGVTNGFTASLVKVDFDTYTAEPVFESSVASDVESKFEIMNILGDEIFFVARMSGEVGRELYKVQPLNVLVFPTSGSREVVTCDTTVYDNGGPEGNYGDKMDASLILVPSHAGAKISIRFIHFDVEDPWDKLIVTNDNSIVTLTGSRLPLDIVSVQEDGKLTLNFQSDFMDNRAGFEIKVSCEIVTDIVNKRIKQNHIYPNPATGIVNIEAIGLRANYVLVTDIAGRVVYEHSLSGQESKIDLGFLENGFYEVILFNGKERYTDKVLLNR